MSGLPSNVPLPQIGEVVGGKYLLERKLGEGGMGAVFAARHQTLDQEVAIKIMLADPAHPESIKRFENEGRNAARIKSDHVVKVFDVAQERGYAFMVLELMDGEDLSQVLERERKLVPHVAVGYVVQALEGVAQAHAQKIIHRDLKPSNLFLTKRPDGGMMVKVLDFGISKSSAMSQAPSQLTSTKAMLGSPLYVSPEQVRSSKSVDDKADIWAIGVILYELITGTLPFMGENIGELFAAILESDPTPIRVRAPQVLPELEAVIMRCLRRKPEERFQSAVEVAQALAPFSRPLAMGTVAMGPPSPFAPGAFGPPAPAPPVGPPGGASTGSGVMSLPMGGAVTGSGVHPPMGPGGLPGGALTPPPGQPWQVTTGGAPKPNNAVFPVLIGVAVLLGVGGLGYFAKTQLHPHPAASSTAPSAEVAPPPPTVVVAAPPLASTPATSPAPVPTSSASASSSPPAAGAAVHPAPVVHRAEPKVEPPKPLAAVDPPKVDPHVAPPPAAPPPPPPAATPKGPATVMQQTR